MPLKVKQKKQKKVTQHPVYSPSTGRHWAEDFREKNQSSFRMTFIFILGIMAAIIILLITAAVNVVTSPTEPEIVISAADTFAVTQVEQKQMEDTAQRFAEGMMFFGYCSDPDVAGQGKDQALSCMANNTSAYNKIEDTTQVSDLIAPENLIPVITNLKMSNPTQAYAGEFKYELDAAAADASVVSEANPNGTFADKGFHMLLTFQNVENDDTGEREWVISSINMNRK